MKKKIMALGLALLLLLSMTTGCVKVVKIGQEGKLTGEVKFNAGDDVAKIWKSKALPELDKKAVDLKEFLTEANGDLKSLVKK